MHNLCHPLGLYMHSICKLFLISGTSSPFEMLINYLLLQVYCSYIMYNKFFSEFVLKYDINKRLTALKAVTQT